MHAPLVTPAVTITSNKAGYSDTATCFWPLLCAGALRWPEARQYLRSMMVGVPAVAFQALSAIVDVAAHTDAP